MPKLVDDFTEGNKDLKDLLGCKGANLMIPPFLGVLASVSPAAPARRAD